jgi:hypothetical protein
VDNFDLNVLFTSSVLGRYCYENVAGSQGCVRISDAMKWETVK